MQSNKIELYYEGKTYQVEEHTLDTLIEHEYAKHLFEGYKSKLENTGLVLEYKDVLIKEAKKLARENAKKRRAIEEGLGDKLSSIGTGIKNAYNNAGGASGIWQKTKDKVKQGFSLAGRATGTAPGNFISGMKDSWLAKRYKINSQELNDYMIKFAATAKTDVDKAKRILYKKLLQKGVPAADVMKFITQAEEHANKLGLGQKANAAAPVAPGGADAPAGGPSGGGGGGDNPYAQIWGRGPGGGGGGTGGTPVTGGSPTAPTTPGTVAPTTPAPAVKPGGTGKKAPAVPAKPGKFFTSKHMGQLVPEITRIVRNPQLAKNMVAGLDSYLFKKLGRLAEGQGNLATKIGPLTDELLKGLVIGGGEPARTLYRKPEIRQALKTYLAKFLASPNNLDIGNRLMRMPDARAGMTPEKKAKLDAMRAAQGTAAPAAPAAPAQPQKIDVNTEVDKVLGDANLKFLKPGTKNAIKPILVKYYTDILKQKGILSEAFTNDLHNALSKVIRDAKQLEIVKVTAKNYITKIINSAQTPQPEAAPAPAAPAAPAKAPSNTRGQAPVSYKVDKDWAAQNAKSADMNEIVRQYLKEHKII